MSARSSRATGAIALVAGLVLTATAGAQQPDRTQMDHSQMDHSRMGHGRMPGEGARPVATPSAPAEPVPALTDADRAAAFPVLRRHMEHAGAIHSFVSVNRLEMWDADPGSGAAWEATGWLGSDLHRLWVRTEGERAGGQTEAADAEVLYGHSVSAWWDVVAGVRHDFEPGSHSWAAIGVQGLAPYKFEVAATAYVGESGRAAARLEVEYELLLTNRLILQPLIELNAGSGLGGAEAGLRLRYEIHRQFAPYIGIVYERALGSAADRRRAGGEPARDTRAVAGLRLWF